MQRLDPASKSVDVHIKLPAPEAESLKQITKAQGTSVSAYVREAINAKLKNEGR